jgi:malonate-semialdehyde dehydrogenase (acetylating)/methylmalonate-semialdehyde dehydrogenase
MTTPTRITHLVDGADWTGTAERTGDVYNPATGQVTGRVDLASTQTVGEVVASAKAARRRAR